jgi:hypothetical protein
MPETSLTKTAQLLKYFAQQYPGVPRTRLVKLVYMSDLLARQYLGKPISAFDYHKDNHGPYDRSFPEFVKELEDAGLAESRRENLGEGYRAYRLFSFQPVPFDFTAGELEVLRYVCQNYIAMDMREFLDEVVYQTPPMLENPRDGERLNMESMDHTGTRQVGFHLEKVLQAEQEAAAGDYVTLSDLLNELRPAGTAVRS